MMTRREFVAKSAALALGTGLAAHAAETANGKDPFWAYLVHLGYNMWGDREAAGKPESFVARDELRFDDSLWKDLIPKMKEEGVNMAIIDLGDGVQYDSHPEIAVKNAWSPARLKEELQALREAGIEPIPKMNFSTCHDVWLKQYARQVSTDAYYKVCTDLIEEAVALFDRPRLFHLGMDEETAEIQQDYAYVVVRQYDLWWHDLRLLCDAVEKGGARPWMWADYCWTHPKEFLKRMPKSVLLANWYYDAEINPRDEAVQTYRQLEDHEFDQTPTGSNHVSPENFGKTVAWCAKQIDHARLKGFIQTAWRPTQEPFRKPHFEAIEQVGRARVRYAEQAHEPTQA